MKYYIFIEGPGEGCDYTVGCNQKFKKLNAKAMASAHEEAEQIYDDHGGSERIEKLTVIEVNDTVPCDVDGWERKAREEHQRYLAKQQEAKERAEFERLSKKFAKE